MRIGFLGLIGAFPPRNRHLRPTAEHVCRGILEAGSHPLEFPGLSLGEAQMRPTAVPYCNLALVRNRDSITLDVPGRQGRENRLPRRQWRRARRARQPLSSLP